MRPILLAALLALPAAASAQTPCALRVAQLVSEGENAALVGLFKSADAATRRQVEDISGKAGRLSNLAEASQPRFSQPSRLSAHAAPAAAGTAQRSLRVNAESAMQGPVQLHLAVQPETDCALLALHLDTDARGRTLGGDGGGPSPTAKPVVQVYL